jgi:TM2 domain-containing membrane protein YozV
MSDDTVAKTPGEDSFVSDGSVVQPAAEPTFAVSPDEPPAPVSEPALEPSLPYEPPAPSPYDPAPASEFQYIPPTPGSEPQYQTPAPQQQQSYGYQQPPQPQQQPYYGYQQQPYVDPASVKTTDKDRVVAGLLGILLGSLGIHKFYLGYQKEGLIMLLVAIFGSCITFGVAAGVMAIIGLIEGIMYLTKSQQEFEQTYVYNRKGWF